MRILISILIVLASTQANAQKNLLDSVNLKRDKIARTGMTILGTWSLANIGTGLVGYQQTTGTRQQFHRVNTIISGVNLTLAGLTYYAIQKRRTKTYSTGQTFKLQESAEKLFLFNTALDLGYVAVGFYLRERANRFNDDKFFRVRGTGNSLLLQGGFLTLFDAILYFLNNKNGNRLDVLLNGLSLAQTKNGLGLVYSLGR